jgi:hypothetical protein
VDSTGSAPTLIVLLPALALDLVELGGSTRHRCGPLVVFESAIYQAA